MFDFEEHSSTIFSVTIVARILLRSPLPGWRRREGGCAKSVEEILEGERERRGSR